jgi:4'-phosphopantetheinyl transferase
MDDLKIIHILFTKIPDTLPEDVYKNYLIFLPESMRERHFRFRWWQDRAANLFSKILLIKGLQKFGFDHTSLEELNFNQYGRPYLAGLIDFNISHSGDYVLCAIGKEVRLGIDIEKIKPVDFTEFESLMTAGQWQIIKNSSDPLKTFFKFWAIKESIIKADGRGLGVPLNEIIINDHFGYYEEEWHLRELQFDENYCANLACDLANPIINFEQINIATI